MLSNKRVLISGYNIDSKTGYGNQTSYFVKAFQELNYTFSLLTWDDSNNVERQIIEKDNYKNYISKQSLSESIKNKYNQWLDIEWASNDFNADVIIFIHDIWFFGNKKEINGNINSYLISLYPLHNDPLDLNEFKIIEEFDMILAMSKWSHTILKNYHNNVIYFPNIISNVFFDNFIYDKKCFRNKFNIPKDSYCFLIIG